MEDPAALRWLPRSPQDFRARCAEVDKRPGRGDALRQLAGHALGVNELQRLARSVDQALADGAAAPLQEFTLGLVSNTTTDFIAPALIGSAARHGMALRVAAATFGMTMQAALDLTSEPLASRPHAILLALDYRAYFADYAVEGDPEARVTAAIRQLQDLVAAFSDASRAVLLVQTIAAPPERLFGSFDRGQPGTGAWLAAAFNQRLSSEVLRPGVSLLDVEALANQVGLASWFDRSQYMTARLPFASRFVPIYAEHVARLIGAIRGRSRKVLVLDLDNTLWHGVIGDDGIDGIHLGQGDPRGEAHQDLQRAALALKQRGILLAISSKNDEAVARQAIREHPEMLLREADFSAMQINWSDKATNLEVLADRLSLGIDSFVFLDDNPAERAQVRASLPEVLVPELPSDPAEYAAVLMASGAFEAVSFSEEDRQRAEQYAANARRDSLAAQSRDLAGFLASLQMRIFFTADGDTGWSRFTQLINKS
ncbi:MAG TPA: HAD-IIIC family phosphatase, partial [Acetobacteraceae bacterium]|nr:HAD-IIIC family phosphatase [Acetobacteraceae bacterium]